MKITALILLLSAVVASCSGQSASAKADAAPAERVARPSDAFCSDSAYANVAAQVAMGPRTPGSDGAARCARWAAERLHAAGADTVAILPADATRFDGKKLRLENVFASFGADASRRVLLLAHYDTRPWADMEADAARRMQPIPGANDGASGVGVLLEIARCLGAAPAKIGVDILLVDGEDSGFGDMIAPEGLAEKPDTWCLGTQAWLASDPYKGRQLPAYAVLLDMVGGAGARFHREQFSDASAARIVDRIWAEAASLGYADTFVDRTGGAIVDDHLYVARAGVPSVDIIEHINPATGSFPPYWHTHADDMDNIDPATLERVGRTVLSLLYKEK